MYEKLESVGIKNFDVKNQLPFWVYGRAMQAAQRGEQARAAIQDKAGLERRQNEIREGIERCLGGLPAMDTPLRPQITGTVKGSGFRVEKVIFKPRPNVYATSNVYIPDDLKEPRGAVLLLCGHRDKAKHSDEYQTVCQYLVHSGLVVMSLDPVGQGERYGYYDPETKQARMTSVFEHENVGRQCLPLGDSLARYMLHDALRAIDYLCTRPEVASDRIGVVGHSGGGTQTALVMMYDQRVAAAAPGGFIMNRPYFLMTGKTQDAEQKWPGFSALGLDHEDILLAMAPRPVRVLATTYDSVPIEAPRHNVAVNRRFWEMLGQGDKLDIYEDENVHRFSLPLARAAAEFFSRHLNGQAVVPADELIQLIPWEELVCTGSGQVEGELPQAKNIHKENVERLASFEAERQSLADAERKGRSLEWLREAVYRDRRPVDLNPRLAGGGEADGLWVIRTVWWSQFGLLNHGLQFYSPELAGRKLPVTIAVWDGGSTRLEQYGPWIKRTCESGRLVIVLTPTGIGPLFPHMDNPDDDPYKKFGVLDKFTDELMWLGDSMAAVRTYDVLRAVELTSVLKNADPDDVELYGSGRYAIYAQLAGLLEPRIRKISLGERMASIADWVKEPFYEESDSLSFILPGMLRYFDLPDVERWLAEEGRLNEVRNV